MRYALHESHFLSFACRTRTAVFDAMAKKHKGFGRRARKGMKVRRKHNSREI